MVRIYTRSIMAGMVNFIARYYRYTTILLVKEAMRHVIFITYAKATVTAFSQVAHKYYTIIHNPTVTNVGLHCQQKFFGKISVGLNGASVHYSRWDCNIIQYTITSRKGGQGGFDAT
jgi:hypothetical protein